MISLAHLAKAPYWTLFSSCIAVHLNVFKFLWLECIHLFCVTNTVYRYDMDILAFILFYHFIILSITCKPEQLPTQQALHPHSQIFTFVHRKYISYLFLSK